jgi:hypothetical protein
MLSAEPMLQLRSIYSTRLATAFLYSAVLMDEYKGLILRHQTDKKHDQS